MHITPFDQPSYFEMFDYVRAFGDSLLGDIIVLGNA